MKLNQIAILFLLFIAYSCADAKPAGEIEKLGEGIYKRSGWIYDMKELPSGKNVIPFYTVGKLSDNTLQNSATSPASEMGITLYFVVSKEGATKNEITSGYFESTSTDSNLFKFPRCLSVCPLVVEVIGVDGAVETLKSSYSRPNVFKMEMEDLKLSDLAKAQKKIRIRIPISINNQNTIFEWFLFDLKDFSVKLK